MNSLLAHITELTFSYIIVQKTFQNSIDMAKLSVFLLVFWNLMHIM